MQQLGLHLWNNSSLGIDLCSLGYSPSFPFLLFLTSLCPTCLCPWGMCTICILIANAHFQGAECVHLLLTPSSPVRVPKSYYMGFPVVRTVDVGFAFVEEQQLPSWAWTDLDWSGSLDRHQALGKLGHPSSPSLCVPYTLSTRLPTHFPLGTLLHFPVLRDLALLSGNCCLNRSVYQPL